MNFSETQNKSPQRFVGIGLVIGLHVLLALILMSGLGKHIVKVIEPPVELRIIQEVKPPPPPPPKIVEKPQPPKMVEKVMQAPTPKPVEKIPTPPKPDAPVKATPTPTPTPTTPSPSPVAPPAPAAPPAPPAPPPKPAGETHGVKSGEAGCAKPEYPRDSLMNEEQGTVVVSVLVDTGGNVIKTKVKKSSGSAALDKAASKAWSQCTFKPAMKDGVPQQDWYDLEYSFVLS